MPNCSLCGFQGFKTWQEYHNHHLHKHNVKPKASPSLIDSIEALKPMNRSGRTKQEIVEAVEMELRTNAWLKPLKLNPLIGTTNISREPIWNEQKEVL